MITQTDILTNEVRALSWKQPFAELMKPPHNKQETRTWGTTYRGLVLICSSSQPYSDRELIAICGEEQYSRILQVLGTKWFNVVKRGSAIAVGQLAGCKVSTFWGTDKGAREVLEEKTFVKYNPDLHIHIYEDVTPIDPFPWRGQLGFKTLTQEEKQRIKIL